MLKSGGVVYTVISGTWEVEVKGPLKVQGQPGEKEKQKFMQDFFFLVYCFIFPHLLLALLVSNVTWY